MNQRPLGRRGETEQEAEAMDLEAENKKLRELLAANEAKLKAAQGDATPASDPAGRPSIVRIAEQQGGASAAPDSHQRVALTQVGFAAPEGKGNLGEAGEEEDDASDEEQISPTKTELRKEQRDQKMKEMMSRKSFVSPHITRARQGRL